MNYAPAKYLSGAALLSSILALPAIAFAQVNNICGVVYVINAVASWFGIVVFIVSTCAFLYAAFLYFTSGGNEDSLTTARTVLIYAVIGTGVALLSTSGASIVSKTIGGNIMTVEQCATLFPG